MAKQVQVKESKAVIADRQRRLKWWREARFGMFIHYGLYAQMGRGEWVMNRERIPAAEYDALADTFAPKRGCADEWAAAAKAANMKYVVLTTKHHEGFCLWDTQQTDFNSVKRGPHRDIVAEYVAACRKAGLRVGLYYSLMDWRHADGAKAYNNEKARQRLVDFTHNCVRELMTNYGKIDVLWYDVMWPLKTADRWRASELNAMARKLQPDILINNRTGLPEDFCTPEGHIKPEEGKAWESCMTFNGSWGYVPMAPEEWLSPKKVLEMLRQCANGGGNLLLNIGPEGDGTVPALAIDRMTRVGKWLRQYGEAVYGQFDPIKELEGWAGIGWWSRRGNTCYYWITAVWPGQSFSIGGLLTKVKSVKLMPTDKPLPFTQTKDRLLIQGLPKTCPDKSCDVGMLKIEFAGEPKQRLGEGTVYYKAY
ncbi:MAG: alpha-L-fucosidase [Phycisphaerae bacterium]